MLKTKRDPNKPAGRTRFVIMWTLGMLLAQVISSLVSVTLIRNASGPGLTSLFVVASSLLLPIRAFIQVQLVERLLKRSMRGWTLYTITGFVMTLVIYFVLQTIPPLEETFWSSVQGSIGFYGILLLSALLSGLPTLAFQTFWLRRNVKQAWLWLIVGVGLMLVSTGSQLATINFGTDSSSLSSFVQLLLTLIYWIVPGLAMYHMMTNSAEAEKAKVRVAVAEDEALAEGRIHRLQEAEETAQPWGEEQQRQNRGAL